MTAVAFVQEYGAPRSGSGVALAELGLEGSPAMADLAEIPGYGVFEDGLVSIASERELVGGLGGWETWLPKDARLFGTSAFGLLLLVTAADEPWVVDVHHGQIVESDLTVPQLVATLAETESRDDILRAPLFRRWHEFEGDALAAREVLCPTPVPALGGAWSIETLARMSLEVLLSFTAQLFDDPSATVEIRRRRR